MPAGSASWLGQLAQDIFVGLPQLSWNKKIIKINALYLSVNVLSTKVLVGDTISTSSIGDGAAILHGHQSHVKV